MSYTVITTNRGHQTAVVAALQIDVLSIAKAARIRPGEAVTVFTETGRWVSIAELEMSRERAVRGRTRLGG
ncbi:hypothetical protein [Chenggangzhangella methanolivorans]|uniref:Uncharacterized protein n=1 Tax=Chenggangzhangella methanolivorans TaxID=1437009 RepID=A0A9E6RAD3_9HYPH|nr:hypothetical protein [Chenggangzhangella methanolivorans]QZO01133.1 hypothetical protein K6K41_06150 [Chenggangzhangella methanolivorans]